jgi:hypothetical protein
VSKSLTFQFEAYLTRAGIKESELSASIKKKIQEVRIVQSTIQDLRRDLEVEGLSDKKKAQLQGKMDTYEGALPTMDDEILQAIKKWEPKRAQYAAAGQRLQAAAQSRKGAPAPAPTPEPTPAPAPVPDPPAPAPPAAKPPAPTDEPAGDNKKKKMGVFGWILIVGGALVLGVGGVALAKRASERAGV